jgi:hypothetical protein
MHTPSTSAAWLAVVEVEAADTESSLAALLLSEAVVPVVVVLALSLST